MWEFLWSNSEKIGDLSTALAAILAVFGVGFAAGQISSNRAAQREATAKEVWRGYELLSFENPQYATPEPQDLDLAAKTFDGSSEKFKKYEWFVSYMLLACEEMIQVARGRPDWMAGIKTQIEYHETYLLSEYFQTSCLFLHLAPELRGLIEHRRKIVTHGA